MVQCCHHILPNILTLQSQSCSACIAPSQASPARCCDTSPLLGQEAVRSAAVTISEACSGLLIFLQKLAGPDAAQGNFKEVVQKAVLQLDQMEWLAPPMLTPKRDMGPNA